MATPNLWVIKAEDTPLEDVIRFQEYQSKGILDLSGFIYKSDPEKKLCGGDYIWIWRESQYHLCQIDPLWTNPLENEEQYEEIPVTWILNTEEQPSMLSGVFFQETNMEQVTEEEKIEATRAMAENKKSEKQEIMISMKNALVHKPSAEVAVRNNSVQVFSLNDQEINKILNRKKIKKEKSEEELYQYGDIVIEVFPKDKNKEVVASRELSTLGKRELLLSSGEKENAEEEGSQEEEFLKRVNLRNQYMVLEKKRREHFWNMNYEYYQGKVELLKYFTDWNHSFTEE